MVISVEFMQEFLLVFSVFSYELTIGILLVSTLILARILLQLLESLPFQLVSRFLAGLLQDEEGKGIEASHLLFLLLDLSSYSLQVV